MQMRRLIILLKNKIVNPAHSVNNWQVSKFKYNVFPVNWFCIGGDMKWGRLNFVDFQTFFICFINKQTNIPCHSYMTTWEVVTVRFLRCGNLDVSKHSDWLSNDFARCDWLNAMSSIPYRDRNSVLYFPHSYDRWKHEYRYKKSYFIVKASSTQAQEQGSKSFLFSWLRMRANARIRFVFTWHKLLCFRLYLRV